MKRKIIIKCMILLIAVLSIAIYRNRDMKGEMQVYNSSPVISGNYHKERLVVIVDQKRISDRQECAERIVKKCRDNSFKNVRFSYDLSKPNELDVTVCLNEKQAEEGEAEFRFRCIQEAEDGRYNIIDHLEKFHIEILQGN